MTEMPTRRLGASDADWAHLTPKNIVDLGVDASQPGAKTRMRWVMYQGREDLGPILAVEQEIRGEWHSTGGSWYLETLVSGDRWSRPATGDIIPIDFGAKWYAYNLQDAIVAATHRLKVSTSGLGATPYTDRDALVDWANDLKRQVEAAGLPRPGRAPLLTPAASSQQLLRWLAWAAPNSRWADPELVAPSRDELWGELERQYLTVMGRTGGRGLNGPGDDERPVRWDTRDLHDVEDFPAEVPTFDWQNAEYFGAYLEGDEDVGTGAYVATAKFKGSWWAMVDTQEPDGHEGPLLRKGGFKSERAAYAVATKRAEQWIAAVQDAAGNR